MDFPCWLFVVLTFGLVPIACRWSMRNGEDNATKAKLIMELQAEPAVVAHSPGRSNNESAKKRWNISFKEMMIVFKNNTESDSSATSVVHKNVLLEDVAKTKQGDLWGPALTANQADRKQTAIVNSFIGEMLNTMTEKLMGRQDAKPKQQKLKNCKQAKESDGTRKIINVSPKFCPEGYGLNVNGRCKQVVMF